LDTIEPRHVAGSMAIDVVENFSGTPSTSHIEARFDAHE
jgi:hypothetical protein